MLSVKNLTSEERRQLIKTAMVGISINQWGGSNRILFTLAVTNQTNPPWLHGLRKTHREKERKNRDQPTDGKTDRLHVHWGKARQGRGKLNSRCYDGAQVIADCLHVRPLIYREYAPERDRQQLLHHPGALFQAGDVAVEAVGSPPFPAAHLDPVGQVDRAGLPRDDVSRAPPRQHLHDHHPERVHVRLERGCRLPRVRQLRGSVP
jgi:hypothetical protein